jgi:hypothetical protein
VGQQVVGDGTLFRLETNPITERNELTIIADEDGESVAPGDSLTQREKFALLFDTIKDSAPTIAPTGTDATFVPPFPLVPRNAALSVQFSDLLDHSRITRDTVRLAVGSPPLTGFEARVIPDLNHGAFVSGLFHTTRVLIDTTVSQFEGGGVALALNSVGMPAGPGAGVINAAIRIPTRPDASIGQFIVIRNRTGGLVQFTDNGPTQDNATQDVVRAFRTGSPSDPNNGFLRDDESPTIRGVQPVTLPSTPQVTAADESLGDIVAPAQPGLNDRVFLAAIDFSTAACAQTPAVGDFLIVNGATVPEIFAVVTRPAAPPQGSVALDVRVRLVRDAGADEADLDLLASEFAAAVTGRFESSFRSGPGVVPECFLQISPPPGLPPTGEVSTKPRISVRFSEPMDPESVLPFDNFRLDRESTPPTPDQVVIGTVTADPTLREFRFATVTALNHTAAASSRTYFFNVVGGADGITDLAGNPLLEALPPAVPITVSAGQPMKSTGGIALRFHVFNEFGLDDGAMTPTPFPEVRDGQIQRDIDAGVLLPREVQRGSLTVTPAIVSLGTFSPSVNCGSILTPAATATPFHPLGSRMMTLWRYCDLGMGLFDEDTINIDVEGLSWTPLGGTVSTAFFSKFEIELAHSAQLPDGGSNAAPGAFPNSGLNKQYDSNVLNDPDNTPRVVHPRDRGYLVTPTDVFMGADGQVMAPYPLNRDVPASQFRYYTWRDTAILGQGGNMGGGTEPIDWLTTSALTGGVCLDAQNSTGDLMNGVFPQTIHNPGQVPSIGLPLLMDFKCFPEPVGASNIPSTFFTDTGLGALLFQPFFRLFSTGGFTASGQPVTKNPDAELSATGGLNNDTLSLFPLTDCPTGNPVPQGAPIPGNGADNVAYFGQLDYVRRISRTYTRWFDTGATLASFPRFSMPIVEPAPGDQPTGTAVVLAFRGADSVSGADITNASFLDEYGDPFNGRVFVTDNMMTCNDPSDDIFTTITSDVVPVFTNGDNTWKDDISEIDGSRFFQVRITFVSNAATMPPLTPELSSLAVPFEVD